MAPTDAEKEKAKKRKQQQKENRKQRRQLTTKNGDSEDRSQPKENEKIVIEYVSAPLEFDFGEAGDPMQEDERPNGLGSTSTDKMDSEAPLADFKKIFERFASAEEVTADRKKGEEDEEETGPSTRGPSGNEGDNEEEEEERKDAGARSALSKKQRKMMSRLKVSELKQACERPEVVEVWDVTAPDPHLLAYLKGYRNTVPVPGHWSQKRKYLIGKRGIEKPPFQLPAFIEATGIGGMRQAYEEKEDTKKLKAKQRDRMAPKMGKMDIDYQILHDAFFKHQTKPKLTPMGDLYYEGKEFEAKVENLRPGVYSQKLKEALGMTSEIIPPPWLVGMQRFGPPPSYPDLKIQGLNCPIPRGAAFGFHVGGWGKPPVDEWGTPLYGDVFGQHNDGGESDGEVDKTRLWGQLEPEVYEEEEEEEEEEEQQQQQVEDKDAREGTATGLASGLMSGLTSGIASSLPSGFNTPDAINLRKTGVESEQPQQQKQLYKVLEQKQVSVGASALMGTDHVYVIPSEEGQGQGQGGKNKDRKKLGVLQNMPTDVEVNLTPEEVEGLDETALRQLYEDKLAEARGASKREDFSDMVAARAAQQKRKNSAQDDKAAKKSKGDFKF